ncbi:YojF family protein [Peribacillus kribbensis]|uniref:YojF family protein n=1 Tax=Peribacillus kribbensis TaxID=356658 RepID=UPI00040AE47E|nr:YojF family protein [Peribacillus kribbensis]
MEPILLAEAQSIIDSFAGQDVYLHLETTNGAYASHFDETFFSAGAYIRNALIQYEHGKITGAGPYRAGLKLSIGWVYAEGLTHFEVDGQGRLLMAGLDPAGKLAVALEISKTPFE